MGNATIAGISTTVICLILFGVFKKQGWRTDTALLGSAVTQAAIAIVTEFLFRNIEATRHIGYGAALFLVLSGIAWFIGVRRDMPPK